MVENTNADVERALEVFGGSTLKYRSFGTFTPKPNASYVANPGARDPDDPAAEPFVAPQAAPAQPIIQHQPPAPPGGGGHADTLYPLLGAALPEAASVPVAQAADPPRRPAPPPRAPAPAPRAPAEDAPPPVARQSRPATAYVPPTTPAPSVVVPPPPAPRPPLPVETPVPPRSVVTTPVAERGWVPPPPAPAPEPPPPAPPPPPLVPPPQPVYVQPMVAQAQEAPIDVRPAVAPTVAPSVTPPVAADSVPMPMTSLAEHFAGVGPSARAPDDRRGGPADRRTTGSESADHRSLVEMFRLLSGASEAPRPAAVTIGRQVDEEPGLFRRL